MAKIRDMWWDVLISRDVYDLPDNRRFESVDDDGVVSAGGVTYNHA